MNMVLKANLDQRSIKTETTQKYAQIVIASVSEAIQKATGEAMDCFVTIVPRNDDTAFIPEFCAFTPPPPSRFRMESPYTFREFKE